MYLVIICQQQGYQGLFSFEYGVFLKFQDFSLLILSSMNFINRRLNRLDKRLAILIAKA